MCTWYIHIPIVAHVWRFGYNLWKLDLSFYHDGPRN